MPNRQELTAKPRATGDVAIVTTNDVVATYLGERARRRGLRVAELVCVAEPGGPALAAAVDSVARRPGTTVIAVVVERLEDLGYLGTSLARARDTGRRAVVLPVRSSDAALGLGAPLVRDFLDACGAHPVRSASELLDVAYAFWRASTLPVYGRVCVLTGSGGVGVLIADRAEQEGLDVALVPAAAQDRLRELVPFAGVGNPIDTTAQLAANPDLFADFLRAVLPGGTYDVSLSFMTHVGLIRDLIDRRRASLVAAVADHPDVVHVMSLLSTEDVQRDLENDGFLVFEDPADAAVAVAALVQQGRRMAQARLRPAVDPPASKALAALRVDAPSGDGGDDTDGRVHLRLAFDRHPVVGPVMTLGWAGSSAWMGPPDEVVTVAPSRASDARRSLLGLAAADVFHGVRGGPRLDLHAAAEAVAVLSRHAQESDAGPSVRRLGVLPAGSGVRVDVDEQWPRA